MIRLFIRHRKTIFFLFKRRRFQSPWLHPLLTLSLSEEHQPGLESSLVIPPCRRALLRGHHCAITHPIPYTVSSKPSLKPSDLLSHPIAQRRHPRPHPFGPSSATATVHEVKSVNHRMYGLYAYWQQWRVKQDIVYQDLPLFYASWKRNGPSAGLLSPSPR